MRTAFFSLALSVSVSVLPAAAGVIIVEKTTMPDGAGATKTATHTTWIEGDLEKIEMPDGSMIMDVAKGTMTIVNAREKTATEMDLAAKDRAGGAFSAMMTMFLANLKPTGGHKTVAGYPCDEYQTTSSMMGIESTTVACFASAAPGAAEYSAFYRKLLVKMGADASALGAPKGVILASETTSKGMAQIPGLPPEIAKKMAEAQAKQGSRGTRSEVTSIKTGSVGADLFAIPAGYKKQSMKDLGRPPGGDSGGDRGVP